jgi:ribosomal protein S18 acetylase RimI-like enzyme
MTTVTARPTDRLTDVDHAGTIATLVVAFSADPVIRWLYPATDRYLVAFPELLHLAGGAAFASGTADRTPDDAGAALWVPPGTPFDEEAAGALLERTVDETRHGDVFGFLEQVSRHHPQAAHWYLPFIGVDPRCQGRGVGSALLARGLARCERDGLPAYLEASSPRNRVLYERHGFQVLAEIRAADSPPLWPMLRTPEGSVA